MTINTIFAGYITDAALLASPTKRAVFQRILQIQGGASIPIEQDGFLERIRLLSGQRNLGNEARQCHEAFAELAMALGMLSPVLPSLGADWLEFEL